MEMRSEKTANLPTWIWYPGDYEIWLGNKMQNRRTERGVFFPPFWKMDSHYVLVEFSKQLNLSEAEEIAVLAEGQANIKLDGKMFPANSTGTQLNIPAGKHKLNIKVYNQANVPSIFVNGKTVKSNDSWLVTYEDKEWIDESGKASDTSTGTVYLNAGSWNFNDPQMPPSKFKLETTPMSMVKAVQKPDGILYDFGKETFGFLVFHGLKGHDNLNIYYGESEEEAMAVETCETLDKQNINMQNPSDWTTSDSRAFRYVFVENTQLTYDSISMLYEYLPLEYKGNFRCNDELLNKIWDISAYTLHLTTREFFIDGVKRDRWVWSGDAYQSYLMNYYLFFDSPSVKRTMLNLRGKDPVTSHINTIMDYTFYWFLGIYDYYQYTGDKKFIEQLYPRMKTLMDYCLSRRNENGMMEGLVGDWVFIDWADFKMSKAGEVSFEQLLFYRSLKTMLTCAEILNNEADRLKYNTLADNLRTKIFTAFWNENKGAFIHNREQNLNSEQITPFTNMFAVIFNELDEAKKQAVKQNVLLNPQALKITTPYMRFYELEALCMLGEHKHVLDEIRSYWGGMLDLDATSFWEKYNPAEKGAEHLAMYGRPFGKSLCHAWGASPLYLFGKYYLGVKPASPAYKTYSIEPNLGGLQWIEGDVPTPEGKIHIYCNTNEIRIKSDTGAGVLRFSSKTKPVCMEGNVISKGDNQYEMEISANKTYIVKYMLLNTKL